MNKDWYTSKTVWVSVASLLFAILTAMGFTVELDTNTIYAVLAAILGLLGITLRDAIPTS